jgi:RNA polymerase sigma factor (TIGR02999 family)
MGSRVEFLRLMAAQMKRHLVDHARRRSADKRGGGVVHSELDASNEPRATVQENPEAFLSRLDAALEKLAAEHPRVAEIIRLRFVADLSIEAAARELNLSSGTVKRDYAFGRVWLMRELGPLE